jgi:hypothetical protein
MAPPARLTGLLPKNRAGRDLPSRNLCNKVTPAPASLKRMTDLRRRSVVPLIQTTVEGRSILDLGVRESCDRLHLALAIFNCSKHLVRREGLKWPDRKRASYSSSWPFPDLGYNTEIRSKLHTLK